MANTKMIFSSSSLYLVLFFTISLNLLLSSATTSVTSTPEITLPSSMHIVYTSEMPNNENPDAFNLQILTSVLGSEEGAKKALVYSFKNSMRGFAAKLTPDQVKMISKQPGVVHVIKSVNFSLTGARRINNNENNV